MNPAAFRQDVAKVEWARRKASQHGTGDRPGSSANETWLTTTGPSPSQCTSWLASGQPLKAGSGT